MKISLISLFLTLATLFANAGGVVDNGGGASELAVTYSYQNYAFLVEPCLRANVCELTPQETDLLQALLSELHSPLRFEGRAVLGENLFATLPQAGSVITVNKDRLWKTDAAGNTLAYSIADGLELLTLAMSTHIPSVKPAEAAALGLKVSNFISRQRSVYLAHLRSPNLRLLTLKSYESDILLLDDGYGAFVDVSALVAKQTACSPTALRIYSLLWSPPIDLEPSHIHLTISGRISWRCSEDSAPRSASLTIILKALPTTGTIEQYWHDYKSPLKLTTTPEVILSNIN